MNAYDFDKTIVPFDSTARFALWCVKKYKKTWLRLPQLILPGAGMLLRLTSKERFKESLWRAVFAPVGDLEAEIQAFWRAHIGETHRWYLEKKRPDDVVISASPEFIVRPALDMLGVKALIATPLSRKTGRFTGPNCHGSEKVVRFHREYGEAKVEEFYSDSLSDTPMARLAGKAFLVKGEQLSPWPREALARDEKV